MLISHNLNYCIFISTSSPLMYCLSPCFRIPHYEGHTPLDVIYHLCSAFYCICRKAVFDSKCTYVLLYSLRNISSEFFYDSSSDHLIPTRFGVCSSACYTKLTNIAAALWWWSAVIKLMTAILLILLLLGCFSNSLALKSVCLFISSI